MRCRAITSSAIRSPAGHGIERRVVPVGAAGGGEGMRQDFPPAAGGGERGGAGEAELAEREIDRMHPGVGVGEEAGGLGEGHADDQPLPDCVPRRGGAGIEPGEGAGGCAERGEQARQVAGGEIPCPGRG